MLKQKKVYFTPRRNVTNIVIQCLEDKAFIVLFAYVLFITQGLLAYGSNYLCKKKL